jgi:hypothetical protein
MKLIKTYDSVGNVSEKTYYMDSDGHLIETDIPVGRELPAEPTAERYIYFEKKADEIERGCGN